MLSLQDFFHLPLVGPIIEQITHDGSGLIIIAGMDPCAHIQTPKLDHFSPSGRAGIFRILVRQLLEENPRLKAEILTDDRSTFRVPRSLVRRVIFHLLKSTTEYVDLIPKIADDRSNLLVKDTLSPENVVLCPEAAQSGSRVITQMDTVFRGSEIINNLLSWGVPSDLIEGLRWIIAVQRIPTLCECKIHNSPDEKTIQAIQHRYPKLIFNPKQAYFSKGSCKKCENTGLRNMITAFDFYNTSPDSPYDRPSLLSLEAYMFGLAERGEIPLSDLLRIEKDQHHRTYQLLTTSKKSLSENKITLERKIVELQAANRVLQNRTDEIISLQEIGQALTSTSSLRDLVKLVCRQASILCSADRAVLYYHRDETKAQVLATHGWAPGQIPQQVQVEKVCGPGTDQVITSFPGLPPGVKIRQSDKEEAKLLAGLKVPLIARGLPVGAMIVHSTSKSKFHPGTVALLQALANQAAVAMQRAGLIETLQGKIVQLEAAQEGLAKKERMERELELAHEVQQAVSPRVFPEVGGYKFAARNRPASQVGGDFYDVIDLGSNKFGILIADVSDKGMPAAVYMALTRSVMVTETLRSDSPGTVLENVNQLLIKLGRARMFVPVFYGIIDVSAQTLTHTRAGHDRPILVRGDDISELVGDGVFLGFLDSDNLHLTEETLKLNPGDRLVLYTDGITDTRSPNGELFTRE
jgi:hypothetical protein